MTTAEVQFVFQIISALAAAGGLIYLILELHGWRKAQYVANFTKLVELQLELRRMRVDDPGLVSPEMDPKLAILPPEQIRLYFYSLMQVSLFEVAWFSHEQGQLTDDYFRSWERNMSHLAERPSFQLMWASNTTKIVDDRFRLYVDGIVRAAGAATSSGTAVTRRAEQVDVPA